MHEPTHHHGDGDSHTHCGELLGNLSALIDGELSDEMCAELRQHMAGCTNCRVVYDTTTRTILLYQQQAESQPLPDGVRERLFGKLHLDDLLTAARKG